MSLISFLPAVAAGGILSSLLAAYSVGTEGRAYWYLQASPLRPAEIMAGKLAASVACGAGASLLCSTVVAFSVAFAAGPPSAVDLIFGVLGGTVAGTVAAAVCGLYGIGVSAMFANFEDTFEDTNPNQALSQMGNFMMMVSLFGLFVAAGLAGALAFGLSAVVPAGLAVLVAALVWAVGCAVGGYAVAASGMGRACRESISDEHRASTDPLHLASSPGRDALAGRIHRYKGDPVVRRVNAKPRTSFWIFLWIFPREAAGLLKGCKRIETTTT